MRAGLLFFLLAISGPAAHAKALCEDVVAIPVLLCKNHHVACNCPATPRCGVGGMPARPFTAAEIAAERKASGDDILQPGYLVNGVYYFASEYSANSSARKALIDACVERHKTRYRDGKMIIPDTFGEKMGKPLGVPMGSADGGDTGGDTGGDADAFAEADLAAAEAKWASLLPEKTSAPQAPSKKSAMRPAQQFEAAAQPRDDDEPEAPLQPQAEKKGKAQATAAAAPGGDETPPVHPPSNVSFTSSEAPPALSPAKGPLLLPPPEPATPPRVK